MKIHSRTNVSILYAIPLHEHSVSKFHRGITPHKRTIPPFTANLVFDHAIEVYWNSPQLVAISHRSSPLVLDNSQFQIIARDEPSAERLWDMEWPRLERAVIGNDGGLNSMHEWRLNFESPKNASKGDVERILSETRTWTDPPPGAEDEVVTRVRIAHGRVFGAI